MRDASWYSKHPAVLHVPASAGAEWCPAREDLWAATTPFDPAVKTAKVAPVLVYANEGRWIVECVDCRGAQLACATDLRFMCHCCANVMVGGLWRPTKWPGNRAAVEAALAPRQLGNQNWIPGEKVSELKAENRVMGVG
ncbi:MAG TPA: hypothetical protein VGH54_21575 [Mycobacterium sp.]|jgi:hypothetical protein|uniref:hypothetical protein n=1 Tax=Mycobacterium sp. TaxID=1785 RepID=UPI002F410CE1